MYPDIPALQSAFKSSAGVVMADQYVEVRHPATVGAWKRYTVDPQGAVSQLAFQDAAAKYFKSVFGGLWTWDCDWGAGGVARLDWGSGQLLDVRWGAAEIRDWLGYDSDQVNATAPLSAPAPGQGVWYPVHPIVALEPRSVPHVMLAWHQIGDVHCASPLDPWVEYDSTWLLDTRAGWHEVQQCLSWLLHYAAACRPFTLYPDREDLGSGLLAGLAPEFDLVEFEPLSDDWSYLQMVLPLTVRQML
jgi:hypothetical protein